MASAQGPQDAPDAPPTTVRDFAFPPAQSAADSAVPSAQASDFPAYHAHFEDEPDPYAGAGLTRGASERVARSGTALHRNSVSETTAFGPVRRRLSRANTFKSIEDFSEFEPHRAGWHPGAEPGFDPYKTDGGHASLTKLDQPCDITVVDFSHENIDVNRLTNDTLTPFLKESQPGWATCRWINVNGLSWDVIAVLGQHKSLHKLAIEDIMNTRNRTKTDWYATHAFVIFTMLKLAHVCDEDDETDGDDSGADSDCRSYAGRSRQGRMRPSLVEGVSKSLRGLFRRSKNSVQETESGRSLDKGPNQSRTHLQSYGTDLSTASGATLERTLQRYQAGPNEAKIDYFEKHSALAAHQLGVIAEQVSLFITNDNTIISFFELSADAIEKPILTRLFTADTVLRQSCDASMVGQAIIDAVIDLAIPVATVYTDVIGDLELDVLTRPDVTHTKKLYIVINEINKILAFINPVVNLINALRDHKTESKEGHHNLQDTKKGFIISNITYVYLGDVLDHCLLITETLTSIKSQADGLIDLIFNTISAYQNESMKQLTLATIFFLPLTFLTGYFGQNFEPFTDLQNGVSFFWMIAAPMSFVVVLLLMREMIFEWIKSRWQRRGILQARKNRRKQNRKRR